MLAIEPSNLISHFVNVKVRNYVESTRSIANWLDKWRFDIICYFDGNNLSVVGPDNENNATFTCM